jgi:DNA-directed RNA polymerase subunit RPC12/RpoP
MKYRCSRCGRTGDIAADFGTIDGELLCRPRGRTIDEPCYTRRLRAIKATPT